MSDQDIQQGSIEWICQKMLYRCWSTNLGTIRQTLPTYYPAVSQSHVDTIVHVASAMAQAAGQLYLLRNAIRDHREHDLLATEIDKCFLEWALTAVVRGFASSSQQHCNNDQPLDSSEFVTPSMESFTQPSCDNVQTVGTLVQNAIPFSQPASLQVFFTVKEDPDAGTMSHGWSSVGTVSTDVEICQTALGSVSFQSANQLSSLVPEPETSQNSESLLDERTHEGLSEESALEHGEWHRPSSAADINSVKVEHVPVTCDDYKDNNFSAFEDKEEDFKSKPMIPGNRMGKRKRYSSGFKSLVHDTHHVNKRSSISRHRSSVLSQKGLRCKETGLNKMTFDSPTCPSSSTNHHRITNVESRCLSLPNFIRCRIPSKENLFRRTTMIALEDGGNICAEGLFIKRLAHMIHQSVDRLMVHSDEMYNWYLQETHRLHQHKKEPSV